MLIAVAGPYSASSEELKKKNLDLMNEASAGIYKKGHIPVIGVNAALYILEKLPEEKRYDAMMEISLTIVNKCDALLLIGESPGANMERDLILAQGKPVFRLLENIPENNLI
ncbi:MAG: DUF4406 domain-containing protein [Ignavibacteria bacterium]